jgi:hypothetical protein
MVCSGLRIAAMRDFVIGVQRRSLTVWQVVVTVTDRFVVVVVFVLIASAPAALGTANLLSL